MSDSLNFVKTLPVKWTNLEKCQMKANLLNKQNIDPFLETDGASVCYSIRHTCLLPIWIQIVKSVRQIWNGNTSPRPEEDSLLKWLHLFHDPFPPEDKCRRRMLCVTRQAHFLKMKSVLTKSTHPTQYYVSSLERFVVAAGEFILKVGVLQDFDTIIFYSGLSLRRSEIWCWLCMQ